MSSLGAGAVGTRNIEEQTVRENPRGAGNPQRPGGQSFPADLQRTEAPRAEGQAVQVKLQQVFEEAILQLKCCGLRNVPLVQITGCSCFIWNHSNRTAPLSQIAATNAILAEMNPAQAASYPWHQKLPRLGNEAEFAALRELLQACSYSHEGNSPSSPPMIRTGI